MSDPAKLYACMYAKEFSAQALLRLRPEFQNKPCAVIEGDPPLQFVCSCNRRARALGIEQGMTRVKLDTFPSVVMLKRSRAEEESARTALLECAGRFSPSIEEQSDDSAFLCVIDIAGTERLHGPPARLGKALLDAVEALSIQASVAIASNFDTAVCMARGMTAKRHALVVPPGEEQTALSNLPLGVLDLTEEQQETLTRWGIRTLEMLQALPEEPLIARMGQEGKRLRQLALGTLPHLFIPIEQAFTLEEVVELDSPVEILESLLFVVGTILQQLIVRAANRTLALASVTISLFLECGGAHTRTVRPALPSNDKQLWLKLLHLDLEAYPPNAAVLSLRITAEPGHPSKTQLGLFSPQLPDASRLDVTLARIRAIVGEESVGSPVLKDTHKPDSFSMKPFSVPSGQASRINSKVSLSALRQLRPPEFVTVTLRDSQPVSLFFRKKRYDIERAYGPWLSSGEWWGEGQWEIQQWDLIARSQEGMLLCCCMIRDPSQNIWQLVALYD